MPVEIVRLVRFAGVQTAHVYGCQVNTTAEEYLGQQGIERVTVFDRDIMGRATSLLIEWRPGFLKRDEDDEEDR